MLVWMSGGRKWRVGVGVSVLCGLLGLPAAATQDAGTGGREVAARLRIETLLAQGRSMAGHRVTVLGAVVDRVIGPRVFTIESADPLPLSGDVPKYAAVVVEAGRVQLRQGTPVVVTGEAMTLAGARAAEGLPWFATLNDDERRQLDGRPVVVATAVEAPGGVSLLVP